MTASFTFYSGNGKKNQNLFFFFQQHLLSFSEVSLAFAILVNGIFLSAAEQIFLFIIIGYIGILFFRGPLNLLLCEFPFNPPFVCFFRHDRQSEEEKRRRRKTRLLWFSLTLFSLSPPHLFASVFFLCCLFFSFLFSKAQMKLVQPRLYKSFL